MKREDNLAPVVVFAYNRDDHLKKTLEALAINRLAKDSELFIFVDGPKTKENIEKVMAVRNVALTEARHTHFKNVTVEIFEENRGLAKSIIGGVSRIIGQYGKVIVLEDDLITAPDFLEYMNEGLTFYQNDDTIGAISGFSPAVRKKPTCESGIYRSRTGNSYGWGTWKNLWEAVDWEVKDYLEFKNSKEQQKMFDGIQYGISNILHKQMSKEIDSWAVRWDYFLYKNSLWTVYPVQSHLCNIGFDGAGTTTNNRADRRRNIIATESGWIMERADTLVDWTKWTADSFRPGFFEKIFDFIDRFYLLLCKTH